MSQTRIYRREDFNGELPVIYSVSSSRLLRCYSPLLYLCMRIHRGHQPSEDPERFRRRVRGLLTKAREQALMLGCPRRQVETSEHAIIVSLDGALLTLQGKYRTAWSRRSLEMESYGTSTGGHWFYQALTIARQSRNGNNRDLVEIFYLCLLAGFEGELRGRRQQREELMSSLHRDVRSPQQLPLAIQAQPHATKLGPKLPGYLKWLPLAAAVVFLLVLGGLSVGLLVWQISTVRTSMSAIGLSED